MATAQGRSQLRFEQAVILVGGLGKSPYIHQHLKKRFAGTEIVRDSGDRP